MKAAQPLEGRQPGALPVAPPSGRQYEIGFGDQVAVLTEVGAGLRRYDVGGRALLDGYAEDEMCTGARGQCLIPWPNRIRDGRYRWNDTEEQLDLSEPEKGGAIHGLTRWANWHAEQQGKSSISFRHVQHACQGWPWVLDCRLEYSLSESGLTVRTTATNRSGSACPYGTGAHPYLSAGTAQINGAMVRVPANVYLPVDQAGIPTGRLGVDASHYDLRRPQVLNDRRIDVSYTELLRDDDGRARVLFSRSDGSSAVALWVDEAYPYLEIFTGDTLPQVNKRRTGLGVEPMTCAPNAFNSGDGLVTLQPGESHTAAWGIDPNPL